ncbi:MAG: hypothetical protein WCB63_19450, partial [Polyangiales bacterium]
MPVFKVTLTAAFLCAMLSGGCRGPGEKCAQGTVTFASPEIPAGISQTELFVDVSNPFPDNGLDVVTELTSISGSIADPFARETTFSCAQDVSGPAEVCVHTSYVDESAVDGALSEVPNVEAQLEYIRPSHITLPDPLECSTTECSVVICPEEKNECPEVSSLTVEPAALAEAQSAVDGARSEVPNVGAQLEYIRPSHITLPDPLECDTTQCSVVICPEEKN